MKGTSFVEEMRAAGYPVSVWANDPGDVYGEHVHRYRKILCCLEGSIMFRTPDRDIELAEGDRMVLEPGVPHSAIVGPNGVRCAEAHESGADDASGSGADATTRQPAQRSPTSPP